MRFAVCGLLACRQHQIGRYSAATGRFHEARDAQAIEFPLKTGRISVLDGGTPCTPIGAKPGRLTAWFLGLIPA